MLTEAELRFAKSTRPKVIAQNWDRFGGRAQQIINGILLAEKLDFDFFFIWPKDVENPQMEEEINFFSEEFISQHRIRSFLKDAATPVDGTHLPSLTLSEGRQWGESLSAINYVVPTNLVRVNSFIDEDERANLAKFSENTKIITRPKFLELREKVGAQVESSTLIHARYGDLLNGNWKQYVDPTKYISSLDMSVVIDSAIKSKGKVIVVSDTQEIVEGFGKMFGQNLSLPEFALNDERFEHQCAEMFALAESEEILAPSGSLFSLFAAHMGGKEIQSSISLAPIDQKLLDHHYSFFPHHIQGALKSRDITHYLNASAFSLSLDEFSKLSTLAIQADNKYVTALCIKSISDALDGDSELALQTADRAISNARKSLYIHSDPLFMATATKFAIKYFDSLFSGITNEGKYLNKILVELRKLPTVQFKKKYVLESATSLTAIVQSGVQIQLNLPKTRKLLGEQLFRLANVVKTEDFISNLFIGLAEERQIALSSGL